MKVMELRCNGLDNPLGLRGGNINFRWKLESDEQDTYQTSYQIFVENGQGQPVWDSGVVRIKEQSGSADEESGFQSGQIYSWTVMVQDNHGNEAFGEPAYFSLGLTKDEWKAKWIGCREEDLDDPVKMPTGKEMAELFLDMASGKGEEFEPDRTLNRCRMFRKNIILSREKRIKTAFLSITAHGLYDVKVDGKAVTDTRLNPGFTAYDKYLEFQTYDVADLLKGTDHVMTIVLADGWYRGKFGILGFGNNYGTELGVLAQLDIVYEDESRECIVTDETFRYSDTPVLYADLMIGEKQDRRIRLEDCFRTGFDDSGWAGAKEKSYGYDNLYGISAEPVQCTQLLEPKEIMISPKGETIVDFGQVLAGVVRLRADGCAGETIKLEHSEVLDKEGNFIHSVSGYNRDQTDYFILSGNGNEELEPMFTFHGFRYVKISGYPGELKPESVRAVVLGSALEQAGTFACSDERLNQLQSNIWWSQRGNMLSIPTDCPQRERAGWTGDILVYGKTAVYNQNAEQFLRKWLTNMECEQFDNGLIPVVVPYPLGYYAMQKEAFGVDTSAGWGDAAVAVPWVLYQEYGDKKILEDCFAMSKKWMDFVEKEASGSMPDFEEEISGERKERQKYLWNTGFHFGDWCYPSCKNEKGETDMFRSAYTTKEHVATAMYAYSTDIMSSICQALGKTELSHYYRMLNGKIRQAFSDEYVEEDGSIGNAVQGVYVLALAMNMAEGTKRQKMAQRLADMIRDNGYRLDTGFLSVPFLMDVLVECGYKETAKKILYQDACPSWLYEIKNGATTIWETWNAILEDGTPTHNSYNHYAFGCIGDWMYRELLGIQRVAPGYRSIRICPDFSYGLTGAKGTHKTAYGTIGCEWTLKDGKGELSVSIPAGTQAEICLPGKSVSVGSGTYRFGFDAALTAG